MNGPEPGSDLGRSPGTGAATTSDAAAARGRRGGAVPSYGPRPPVRADDPHVVFEINVAGDDLAERLGLEQARAIREVMGWLAQQGQDAPRSAC